MRLPRSVDSEVLEQVLDEVLREYVQIMDRKGGFHSTHEALGVLEEEFWELKQEIFKRNMEPELLREEAVQVAANALALAALVGGVAVDNRS